MYIEKKENRLKQEITLSFLGVLSKDNIFLYDKELKESINDDKWEKIIIDFCKAEDIDIEVIKLLWDVKDLSNSMQKALEFDNLKGKVAVAFKFLGFLEKFNINVNIDQNILDEVVMLGEYGEPLYMTRITNKEIQLKNQIIPIEDAFDFLNKVDENLELGIKEWVVIPDDSKNKLVFLLEIQSTPDVAKVEKYLFDLSIDKYDIDCSIYFLENGTFEEYYEYKKKLGIPSKFVDVTKVIKNPYTKQYFLGKIDERY